MNVSYVGPLKDYSGYGEANRHDIGALDAAGVNVIGKLVTYTRESSDFGSMGNLVHRVINRNDTYKIKVIHTTPDQFPRYVEKGVYNIGRLFWETDKIPADFAKGLNECQEVWTGSEANRQAAINGGCTRPIFVIPQAIETEREGVNPYQLEGVDPKATKFYSIFEWTDRKNPTALIKAYWEEFQKGENVALIIKTYFRGFSGQSRRDIVQKVQALKEHMQLPNYAPVYLYLSLMDRRQVWRLHNSCDVYVSAHRGEGWGVPQVESMLAGKPIISTGYAGVHEHIPAEYLLPFTMQGVRGMSHSSQWYSSDQRWAEVDGVALKRRLRKYYEDPAFRKASGERAQRFVLENFNLKTVGEKMLGRLQAIEENL